MLKPLRLTEYSRSITSQSKIVTRDPLVIQQLRLRSPDTGCQGLFPVRELDHTCYNQDSGQPMKKQKIGIEI